MPPLGEAIAQSTESVRLSRLIKAGVLLGMVGALSACGGAKKDTALAPPHKPQPAGSFTNPYGGGESLTVLPDLRARYDGVNLRFSSAALNRYLHDSVHHHDHEFVKITMRNGADDSQAIWIENGQGIFEPDPYSATQALKCDPPPPAHECRLTVTDAIYDNYSQPGVITHRHITFPPRYFRSKAHTI